MEVRSGRHSFTIDLDPTNRAFVLSKPTLARADTAKVDALLRRLLSTQILRFVSDSPRVDLEPFGLQSPEAEVSFLVGSNDQFTAQFTVQFGKSLTNDPPAVYARRLTQTNIVLVPRSVLETLLVSHSDVRDLHLVSFSPNAVESIEVIGSENFTARRQTNGTWLIGDSPPLLADTNAVREWLDVLGRLEGEVEKDVVTEFANIYGLSPPARRYLLRGAVTNAVGAVSNPLLAELDLGLKQEDKIFARRPDEATVYSLALKDVAKLPHAGWQLRDRRVWSFTTNQIHRVTIQYGDQARTLQRSANASWRLVDGEGIVASHNAALEETLYRLGELRAAIWVAKGEESRDRLGFGTNTNRITIELKSADKAQLLSVEFGGHSPTQLPYALTVIDGETWVFEFPPTLYFEVLRDFFTPMFRAGP
jgi:hypothetical protein